MAARFHHPAAIQHIDAVGIQHGGKPVGDDDGGAPLHQPGQRFLHLALAIRCPARWWLRPAAGWARCAAWRGRWRCAGAGRPTVSGRLRPRWCHSLPACSMMKSCAAAFARRRLRSRPAWRRVCPARYCPPRFRRTGWLPGSPAPMAARRRFQGDAVNILAVNGDRAAVRRRRNAAAD